MRLNFDKLLANLKKLEKRFNESGNVTEKYAIIQAINHIAEVELPIHDHWEKTFRDAMLKEKGCTL